MKQIKMLNDQEKVVSRRRKIKRVYDVSLAKVVTNRGYIGNERLGVTNGVENINTNETDRIRKNLLLPG